MSIFFSCDWGTSTFRLRLVDGDSKKVLAEIKSGFGIAAAYDRFQEKPVADIGRAAFYEDYLTEQMEAIGSSIKYPYDGLPVIVSGMASSSIGMIELPYKQLPFHCNGSDLETHTVCNTGRHNITIVSGASTANDAIRGEETMLAGCNVSTIEEEQLFIFPGTHSKHISVKNGQAINITTYMTGELFDLLSTKSILSVSVKKELPAENLNNGFFAEGVLEAITTNLANSLFHVRTNQLFKKLKPGENYQYLSGLLIGNELKEVSAYKEKSITLVCGEALKIPYTTALNLLGLGKNYRCQDADEALIEGQSNILKRLFATVQKTNS